MNARNDRYLTIMITIAVAILLTLLPLPYVLDLMRPYWVALVIIYWGLETQDRISLGLGFSAGILLDLLTASLLGLHALSLVILIYLVTRFRARLRFFPPWQQAFGVASRRRRHFPGMDRRVAYTGREMDVHRSERGSG